MISVVNVAYKGKEKERIFLSLKLLPTLPNFISKERNIKYNYR